MPAGSCPHGEPCGTRAPQGEPSQGGRDDEFPYFHGMESADRHGQPPTGPPCALYRERARRFDREAATRLGTVRVYGRLRLALFAATIAGAWLLFAAGRSTAAWAVVAAGTVTFALLVARHGVARRRLNRADLMAAFNREGIARIRRRWSELPGPPVVSPPTDHDYARDLDVCGPASLLHLAGVCGTAPGRRTLREWLLGSAGPDTIALRQEAVREMAGAHDFRDRLAAEARMMEGGGGGVERFLTWAEGGAWLDGRPWLRAPGFVVPVVNLTAIGLGSLGVVPISAAVWPLIVSTIVYMQVRKAIHRVFDEADDGESGLRRFAPLLGHLVRAPFGAAYAKEIRCRLGADTESEQEQATTTAHHPTHPPALREVATLRRLLDLADVRRSPLFHLPLAIVLLWDVHVLAALERWQARSGSRVRDWLDAAGEAEALAALAALAADHPDWTFPDIDPEATTLRGKALGHPLLASTTCVRNDVEVGPAGSFLLVTGSNMSGKSTLIKAIGLNAVLAQAGGPVCARRLRMPPLRIVTSMHVEDSLADGVSYFMAGLYRLKHVVDAAREGPTLPHPLIAPPAEAPSDAIGKPAPAPHTLYLLDEILQGTNSAERRIAARTILRHLLATGAIGAVTTHDLTLADAEDLVERAVAMYFTESVGDGDEGLTFDYRLRDGIATSTNALRLLELVGLGENEVGPPHTDGGSQE